MTATVKAEGKCRRRKPDALCAWAGLMQALAEFRDQLNTAEGAGVLDGRLASSVTFHLDEAECELLKAIPRKG